MPSNISTMGSFYNHSSKHKKAILTLWYRSIKHQLYLHKCRFFGFAPHRGVFRIWQKGAKRGGIGKIFFQISKICIFMIKGVAVFFYFKSFISVLLSWKCPAISGCFGRIWIYKFKSLNLKFKIQRYIEMLRFPLYWLLYRK